MKKVKEFDKNFILLQEMYEDPFFPDKLVKEIESAIREVIDYLESGKISRDLIQDKLDDMTNKINDLEDEFYKQNSEIDSLARESIALSVMYILSWFNIKIDIEDALRFRNW